MPAVSVAVPSRHLCSCSGWARNLPITRYTCCAAFLLRAGLGRRGRRGRRAGPEGSVGGQGRRRDGRPAAEAHRCRQLGASGASWCNIAAESHPGCTRYPPLRPERGVWRPRAHRRWRYQDRRPRKAAKLAFRAGTATTWPCRPPTRGGNPRGGAAPSAHQCRRAPASRRPPAAPAGSRHERGPARLALPGCALTVSFRPVGTCGRRARPGGAPGAGAR
jgi:hypothetical protein